MALSDNAIRHARLPARPGRRDGELRGALERWLADCEPRRYGLPADAIVLVRGVRVGWAEMAGGADARSGDAMATALAGARRPALDGGAVGAATAVWFSDSAELLACLARDALAGPLHDHWWWPTLLRDGTDTAAAIAHWIRNARGVPRAVERLQAMQPGAAWFECWDGSARRQLLAALAQHHVLAAAVAASVEDGGAGSASVPARRSPASLVVALRSHDDDLGEPGAWPMLSSGDRLQRLCRMLARDPMAAADEHAFFRTAERLAGGTRRVAAVQPETMRTGRLVPLLEADGDRRGDAEGRVDIAAVMASIPAASSTTETDTTTKLASVESGAAGAEEFVIATPPSISFSPALDVPTPLMAADTAIVIDTTHAGLFFVVAAALHLGLYGDFSQPQHRGLAVSPFRFLHDVGRAIGKRRFLRDPLAAWLAVAAAPVDTAIAPDHLSTTPVAVLVELRARVVLALGLRDPRRLASALLRVPGRIRIGGERIDIHIALADLPIAVRLAGLDRDPGWWPAAGRDLRFHFD